MAAEVMMTTKDKMGEPVPAYLNDINPAFSFPMASPTMSISPRSADPFSTRSRPADISIQTTPAFLFPPPPTPPLQEETTSSPSRSRPTGHRRGPSEFIGGDGSKLGPGLMSTSPTKGENALPAPSNAGRRRGHAHRRSAAISHHDLANIINKPDPMPSRRTGSAPATPCEPDMQFIRPSLDRARSQPSLPSNNSLDLSNRPSTPVESPTEPSPTTSTTARPRVGFSDKLEFIPRPLSIISSATSSSVSTIRPTHSLNDSITSLRSLNTSSPPSASRLSSDDLFGGALHPEEQDLSPSRDAESRLGKSGRRRHHSPPPPSSTEHLPLQEEVEIPTPDTTGIPQIQTDLSRLRGVPNLSIRPRSSPDSLGSKRSKRGKSWSDLLSRKGKSDLMIMDSSPQSTESMVDLEPDFNLDDVNFDDDDTCVLRNPDHDAPRPMTAKPSPPAEFDPDTDDIAVLDLDEVWYRAGMKSNSSIKGHSRQQSKRAMHSSGATGGFGGPGMHYHRRAESAPVMPPIEYGLGFPRYGSDPQMADVFEEEEDDYNQNSLSRQASRQAKIAKEKKLDTLAVNVEESQTPASEASSTTPTSAMTRITTPASEPARTPNFSFPAISPASMRGGKDLSIQTVTNEARPISLAAPDQASPGLPQSASLHTYASSHASHASQSDRLSNFHGSTEASPLQTSFDVPRLGTAHSSGTDRSAWSSARTGETYPMSTSIDDVPSLVSSSSTMISHIPHTPIIGSRPLGERAHSVSAEATLRPRTPLQAAKRASLASLSKLMGGSFSEKSKLSIESRADYEEEEDTTKVKKRHRLSRLMKMKFWKSKEDVRGLAVTHGQKST